MGIALILGNLYAKACRIYYLMGRREFKNKPIRDETLFIFVGVYGIFYIIPLIVWSAAFPLTAQRKDNNPDNNKVNIVCDGEHADAFLVYFLVLCLLSIVFGVVLSFLLRKIHDFFSEMSYIGYTLYTICITASVVLPMLFILDDTPESFYIVFMLGCVCGNSAALFFLLGPKMYVLFFQPDANAVPMSGGHIQTSRSKSKSSSSFGSHEGTKFSPKGEKKS
jgi:hypothetical protein